MGEFREKFESTEHQEHFEKTYLETCNVSEHRKSLQNRTLPGLNNGPNFFPCQSKGSI